MAEPRLGSLPWKQGNAWGRMVPCPLGLAPWEPEATSQWALSRYRKGLLLRKVGSSRSGQVCSAEAGPSPGWLGRPRAGRRARPSAGPCPGGPANDPAHSGLHGPENWLRAGPLAGILPMLTHQSGRWGRSENLKKS